MLYGYDYGPTYTWDYDRAVELAFQRDLPLYELTDGSYAVARITWLPYQKQVGATEIALEWIGDAIEMEVE